jgi:hypothetical protein
MGIFGRKKKRDKGLEHIREYIFSKPKKVKKSPTKSQLKSRRVSARKHQKIARRIWRKLI